MKQEITRLDTMSVALVYGALLGGLGLVFALLFLVFGSVMGSLMGRSGMSALVGGGVFMVILLPLLYGLFGFIIGAVFAGVYNLVAPRVGGIKMYTREVQ
ncbi:hypothetical protein GCM10027578_04480 [Spirosoma luteolum]